MYGDTVSLAAGNKAIGAGWFAYHQSGHHSLFQRTKYWDAGQL
jgi:hypothetical protein